MSDYINQSNYIGRVIGGSINRGIDIRLDSNTNVEELAVGRFVVIDGITHKFFAQITDITLHASNQSLIDLPPDFSNQIVSSVVSKIGVFSVIEVVPYLTLDGALATSEGVKPAKTVPPHFARTYLASEEDYQTVFGGNDNDHFWLGSPLDLETNIHLNLDRFVERSNGIFGKSGTGKTFLTRLILAGIVQKQKAVNLVFDMQSEYGWAGYNETGSGSVKGLKQLFSSNVALFSMDEEHSKRRNVTPDYLVKVGYNQIEPEDIVMLRDTLNLSDVAADASYTLALHYGQDRWFKTFTSLDGSQLRELAQTIGVNDRALSTLRTRLMRLERFHFLTDQESDHAVDSILQHIDKGIHVVLEFGRYQHEFAAYILVANLITRRIHQRYSRRKEEAMVDESAEPKQLVITIEEAHRFLTPGISSQTIFGTIAREMRKYNVTLLIVDQRPSGIDDEIMSQLGTKLSCLLDNDNDVSAVMSGVSGSNKLRTVISKLDSKQQALIFGHAMPMPIAVKIRNYDEEAYRSLGLIERNGSDYELDRDAKDLFGSH
jgi:DNA helicase HerA-like ATPase